MPNSRFIDFFLTFLVLFFFSLVLLDRNLHVVWFNHGVSRFFPLPFFFFFAHVSPFVRSFVRPGISLSREKRETTRINRINRTSNKVQIYSFWKCGSHVLRVIACLTGYHLAIHIFIYLYMNNLPPSLLPSINSPI